MDVYALGAVLYKALTGEVPFPRDRDVDVAMAHIVQPPPRPSESAPDCPAGFDDVVARAMAKQPADRFASAGELGEAALAAAEPAGPAPEWRSPPEDRPPAMPTRRPWRGWRTLTGRPSQPCATDAALAAVLAASPRRRWDRAPPAARRKGRPPRSSVAR